MTAETQQAVSEAREAALRANKRTAWAASLGVTIWILAIYFTVIIAARP